VVCKSERARCVCISIKRLVVCKSERARCVCISIRHTFVAVRHSRVFLSQMLGLFVRTWIHRTFFCWADGLHFCENVLNLLPLHGLFGIMDFVRFARRPISTYASEIFYSPYSRFFFHVRTHGTSFCCHYFRWHLYRTELLVSSSHVFLGAFGLIRSQRVDHLTPYYGPYFFLGPCTGWTFLCQGGLGPLKQKQKTET